MKTLVRSSESCAAIQLPKMPGTLEGNMKSRAYDLLGYQAPTIATNEAEQQRVLVAKCNDIRQALATLNDPPFNSQSVARYKKKMVWRAKKVRRAMMLTGIFSAFFAATLSGGMLCLWNIFPNPFISLLGVSVAIPCAFVAWMGLATALGFELAPTEKNNQLFYKPRFRAFWQTIPIRDYKKPMPEFALQTAIDLKEQFPEVEFTVEELVLTKDGKVVTDFDPFLRADLPDGTSYYLEVWNEPEFVQTRQR